MVVPTLRAALAVPLPVLITPPPIADKNLVNKLGFRAPFLDLGIDITADVLRPSLHGCASEHFLDLGSTLG